MNVLENVHTYCGIVCSYYAEQATEVYTAHVIYHTLRDPLLHA